MKDIKGVIPPIITPFDSKFNINEASLRKLVDYLVENRIHGVIPTGSTGEFARLSSDERKKVFDIVIDQANGRIPVIAGTASTSTDEVVKLSVYAQNAGADGVMIAPPFYGKPTEKELVEHYRLVASKINIPIMAYNNPWTTGIDLKPSLLAEINQIENVLYVKDATSDTRRVHQIIRATNGKMGVFAGSDDNMFESLVLGAKGWVAGIANFIPRTCVELYELVVEKQRIAEARALYYKVLPVGDLVENSGKFVQYIKAGVEHRGIPVGPPRRPLLPASKAELKTLLDSLGDLS